MAKKTTKAKKVVKKSKEKECRILIYNSIGQVQRNKFVKGTDEEVKLIAEQLRKTVSKGSKIEIVPA
jgi:helix-turn-helix protein